MLKSAISMYNTIQKHRSKPVMLPVVKLGIDS